VNAKQIIWDWPLRLFHWLLVVSLLLAYLSGSEGGIYLDWHSQSGLFVLSLLCFRFSWGFLGSYYSRFSTFYPSVSRFHDYLKTDYQPAGHNPLAALSIFSMLIVILIQSVTGLFMSDEDYEFYGPLEDLIEGEYVSVISFCHQNLINLIITLVILHLLAIIYHSVLKKQSVIMPMITGKKSIFKNDPHKLVDKFKFTELMIAVGIAMITFWVINSGMLLEILLLLIR